MTNKNGLFIKITFWNVYEVIIKINLRLFGLGSFIPSFLHAFIQCISCASSIYARGWECSVRKNSTALALKAVESNRQDGLGPCEGGAAIQHALAIVWVEGLWYGWWLEPGMDAGRLEGGK